MFRFYILIQNTLLRCYILWGGIFNIHCIFNPDEFDMKSSIFARPFPCATAKAILTPTMSDSKCHGTKTFWYFHFQLCFTVFNAIILIVITTPLMPQEFTIPKDTSQSYLSFCSGTVTNEQYFAWIVS